MSSPQMYKFHDRCELVYGKNYVEVKVSALRWLEGYLTAHVDPNYGAFVSWTPFEVMVLRSSGSNEDHPDGQYSLVALVNNMREIRLISPSLRWHADRIRNFPLSSSLALASAHSSTAPAQAPNAASQGTAQEAEGSVRACLEAGELNEDMLASLQEVVIVGVDGAALPGLVFPSGGAEAFLAALAEEGGVRLQAAVATSAPGAKDDSLPRKTIVYTMIRDSLPELPASEEKPHPATLCYPPCSRCVLLDTESASLSASPKSDAAASLSMHTAQTVQARFTSVIPLPGVFTGMQDSQQEDAQYITLPKKRPSPIPKLPKRDRRSTGGTKGSVMPRLLRFFGASGETSEDEETKLREQEQNIAVFHARTRSLALQRCFVAWRVYTYRQNKLDAAMRVLVKTLPSLRPPPPPLSSATPGAGSAAIPSLSFTMSASLVSSSASPTSLPFPLASIQVGFQTQADEEYYAAYYDNDEVDVAQRPQHKLPSVSSSSSPPPFDSNNSVGTEPSASASAAAGTAPQTATMNSASSSSSPLRPSVSASALFDGSATSSARVSPSPFHTPVSSPFRPHTTLASSSSTSSVTMALLSQHLRAPEEISRDGLTPMLWSALFDDNGRVRSFTQAIAAIFANGCDKSLRKEVWKYLLGMYEPSSTQADRSAADELVCQEYTTVTSQVDTIVSSSVDPMKPYMIEHMGNIDLDVSRCDVRFWRNVSRKTPLASDPARSGTAPSTAGTQDLHDVEPDTQTLAQGLAAFVFTHQHLGYVQGMSDVYESLFVNLDCEAAATYKCFSLLMQRVGLRFNRTSEKGIQQCLLRLRQLIEYLDPELFNSLRKKDADHLYFCYRWFLLDFKREFEPEDSFFIWEVIWAAQLVATKNFSVFIAYAILQMHRDQLFKCEDFGQILKYFNNLETHLDARVVVNNAKRALYNVQVSLAHRDQEHAPESPK